MEEYLNVGCLKPLKGQEGPVPGSRIDELRLDYHRSMAEHIRAQKGINKGPLYTGGS